MLWEIYSFGSNPYPGVQIEGIAKYVNDGHRMTKPELCPTSVYGLMELCWQKDAENRPNFLYFVKELDSLILCNVRVLLLYITHIPCQYFSRKIIRRNSNTITVFNLILLLLGGRCLWKYIS